MGYKSYKDNVLRALNKSKKEICNNIGNFITAEAQLRAPVGTDPYDKHKGNLRRSTTFEVHKDNNGVDIGVTKDAPYGIYVHEGSSKNPNPQPFLKDAVMDNIKELEKMAGQSLKVNMGDK